MPGWRWKLVSSFTRECLHSEYKFAASASPNLSWMDRITSEPGTCHGQACIRGTRILVAVILDNLAAGQTPEQIVESYSGLEVDDVRAAAAYGAELSRERILPLSPAQGQ